MIKQWCGMRIIEVDWRSFIILWRKRRGTNTRAVVIMDDIHRKGSSGYYRLDRHIFRWEKNVHREPGLVESRVSPPDSVDDLLTR